MNLRSIFNEKEAARTGARGRPDEHAHVEYFGEVNSLSDAPRRRPGGRGRRVPVQGVLLLIARWRPDDEDRKQLLFVDGTTRPTRRTL